MGMFDDELAEGMRATRELMAKDGLSYDDARREVLAYSPVTDESEAIKLLHHLRQRMESQRVLRRTIDNSIALNLNRINALKIIALEKGWNL